MEILYAACAGLDVHKRTVVACVKRVDDRGRVTSDVRTFGTMTADLLELADWLGTAGVTQVAMEATGVYWKPVWHLLEDRFTLSLINAQQVKKVPGRKSDVKDAEWIAQLLQHGLLSSSFVPPEPIRDLRDLTRQRAQLVRQRATLANRIQRVLEGANIKLASVASDILGVSGREMLARLIQGETDPEALASSARGRLRDKAAALHRALEGRVTDHHRFLLAALMDQVRHLDGLLERFEHRIAMVLAPFAEAVERLVTIPGVSHQAAAVIVAEIGADMSQYPSSGHLSSWAGISPGTEVSAGKRVNGKITKGSVWLRTLLVQVAWAASHTKETILSVTYRRWARRLGTKKALVALAHKILVVIYRMLKTGSPYIERWSPEATA